MNIIRNTVLMAAAFFAAGLFVLYSCTPENTEKEITGGTGHGQTGDPGTVVDNDPDIPTITLMDGPDIPGDEIYVVSLPSGAPMTLLVASLQGIVNRKEARVIFPHGEHKNWANQVLAEYGHSSKIGYEEFIEKFLKYASGYVLADDHNLYSVETTVAGPLNAVILTETTVDQYGNGLKCLLDVRGKDEEWLYRFVRKNRKVFNLNGVIQPTANNALMGVDNAVASRYISFRAKGNEELCRKFYSLITPNSPRLGYGVPFEDEIKDVKLAAEYGLYTIAADWAVNYSFLTKYKGTKPFEPFNQAAETLPDKKSAHYVMLMYSDGDNLDYAIKSMVWGNNYLGNANCEGRKINWEIPPTLYQMPMVYNHYRYNSPSENYFLAATSGAGYTYPSVFKNLDQFASSSYEMIKKCGLEYLVVLDDQPMRGSEKEYLQTMLQSMPELKGLFYMRFENYALDKGAYYMLEGRPVISFRYRLWAGLEPYDQVAQAINAASRDVTSKDAYSAVVVHAWSYTMDDVKKFLDLLDDDVVLVTADEFVRLLLQNVK